MLVVVSLKYTVMVTKLEKTPPSLYTPLKKTRGWPTVKIAIRMLCISNEILMMIVA